MPRIVVYHAIQQTRMAQHMANQRPKRHHLAPIGVRLLHVVVVEPRHEHRGRNRLRQRLVAHRRLRRHNDKQKTIGIE